MYRRYVQHTDISAQSGVTERGHKPRGVGSFSEENNLTRQQNFDHMFFKQQLSNIQIEHTFEDSSVNASIVHMLARL